MVSLELAHRVADHLGDHPERIVLARDNLARWKVRNVDSPRLIRCYEEWEAILARPVAEIQAVLLARTDEGQRLRQTSPFVGVVPHNEVWRIKDYVRAFIAAGKARPTVAPGTPA